MQRFACPVPPDVQPYPKKNRSRLSVAVSCAVFSVAALDVRAQEAESLDTVVVVGNRTNVERTALKSPVPIDVISTEQLKLTGEATLSDALKKLIPSFNIPAIVSTGIPQASVRTGGLRGLGPERTLILVNGKRRHSSSQFIWAGINMGNPVDLDRIPSASVERIEVMRQAASAQYGSDAIAGVINIILKADDHGFKSSSLVGQNYEGDGESVQQELSGGLALGSDGGALSFGLTAKSKDWADRSTPTRGSLYGDQRDLTADRNLYEGYGSTRNETYDASYNLELPIGDDTLLYSFSTLGYRDAIIPYTPRVPSNRQSIPEVYPDGFTPKVKVYEVDYQFVAGAKGDLQAGWKWDLSTSYGASDSTYNAFETLNPSLGADTPTSFSAGSQKRTEWVNNLDFSNAFDIGLAQPLQFATGLDLRHESYEQRAGDPLGWAAGDYRVSSGRYAGMSVSPYAQGVQLVTDDYAGSKGRNVYAAYFDVGLNPTEKLYLGFAGRHERYTDSAGDTTTWKASSRYEIRPELAFRASLGTGFKAPSLAVQTFQQVNAAVRIQDGVEQDVTALILRPDNAVSKALGATELKPEKSRDLSFGFTYEPARNLNFAADYYYIELADRIVSTSQITGDAVNQLLGRPAGYNGPADLVSYFTNGIDTRTYGFDLTGSYLQTLEQYGSLKWSLGFNYNKTEITDIKDTPEALRNLGSSYVYFGQQNQGIIEGATPRDKFTLGLDWKLDAWQLGARLTRYGKYTEHGTISSQDYDYGARWITDLDIQRRLSKNVKVAVGSNNLFDIYPRKKSAQDNPNTTGQGAYGMYSPFGLTGGYYYARLDIQF